MGSRSITPLIPNLGSRRWVSFTTRPLYSRERTNVPTEQETGRTPKPVWMFWRRGKTKSLATTGIRIPEPPAGSLVTIQTGLLRLLTGFSLLIYIWVGLVKGKADADSEIGHSETVSPTSQWKLVTQLVRKYCLHWRKLFACSVDPTHYLRHYYMRKTAVYCGLTQHILPQSSLKMEAVNPYKTVKGKVHPCTGTEALYRPYGP